MNHTFSAPLNATEMKSIVFTAAGVLVVTLTITVTLMGDCLIYAAFYSNTSIRTRANLFFLSLITADILQALFVMPLELVRIVHEPLWPIGDSTTKLWNSMFVCFGTVSACNLAAIGVERYLAITRPLTHHYLEKNARRNLLRLDVRHLERYLQLFCLGKHRPHRVRLFYILQLRYPNSGVRQSDTVKHIRCVIHPYIPNLTRSLL